MDGAPTTDASRTEADSSAALRNDRKKGNGNPLEGFDGEVDDLVEVVVEFADVSGSAVAVAEEDPDFVVGFAVEAFEVVAAVFGGDVGLDFSVGNFLEFDDGSAKGFVVGGAYCAGDSAEFLFVHLRGEPMWAEGERGEDDGAGGADDGPRDVVRWVVYAVGHAFLLGLRSQYRFADLWRCDAHCSVC